MRAKLLALLLLTSPTVAFAGTDATFGPDLGTCGPEDAPMCIFLASAEPDDGLAPVLQLNEHGFAICPTTRRSYDTMHCIEGPERKISNGAALGRRLFDDASLIVLHVPPAEVDEPRQVGAEPWCEEWWCNRHSQHPGQDEDRPDREVAERSEPPARSEPPQRSEPPDRQDPPRCD